MTGLGEGTSDDRRKSPAGTVKATATVIASLVSETATLRVSDDTPAPLARLRSTARIAMPRRSSASSPVIAAQATSFAACRSDERRVGKAGSSTCRFAWLKYVQIYK